MLGYATVETSMILGLVRDRAPVGRFASSLLLAAPLTAIAGAALSSLDPWLSPLPAWLLGPGRLLFGFAVTSGVGYFAGRGFARVRAEASDHRRGALIECGTSRDRAPARAGHTHAAGVSLAGFPMVPEDETKHFKLIGTTGTGKSTAIRELLRGALARGDRAVVADADGAYMRAFYDAARGDLVLNPFDPRSAKWDLFGEIDNPYDVDQLARSLIPDRGGHDSEWRDYARTFLGAVMRQARDGGTRDVKELYRLLLVAEAAELRVLVQGTPAQPFLDEHNNRMFDSIRSVTSSAVAALEYIGDQKGSPLSVRQWVSGRRGGVLFMPYRAGQIATLRSTISAWMRLAIFERMNADEVGQRDRLWFVVDELDALGPIDGLKDALVRLRKFEGRCVLGFQSIAQVSSTYGQGDAHTIVENCGNTLILRCSASEGGGTARFASQLIGEREVTRTRVSRSRRYGEWLGSISTSESRGLEPALLPSEVEQLPDLAGFLKFANSPEWRRVQLDAVKEWSGMRAAASASRAGTHSSVPDSRSLG
jgi:type IV secretory pathway TraG/TraD family ATPase VirD4